MDDQELEALYGPLAQHSEHKKGDHIQFTDDGKRYTGTILWVCTPGTIAGEQMPTRYIVEADQKSGIPLVVWHGDVVG